MVSEIDKSPSRLKTEKHIAQVKAYLHLFAAELMARGEVHDASKFSEAEAGPLAKLDALIEREGNVAFGTKEYERRKEILGPMLKHHYEHNSHHPEHYSNGVDGMDLFDLVEMFVDWKAASERGEQPSIALRVACDRFKVSPQLESIMRNTAKKLGWPVDVQHQ